MREDYLAALDPYLIYMPTRFTNRFRLDLLGLEAARQAIRETGPPERVDFKAEAAGKLLDDLRRVAGDPARRQHRYATRPLHRANAAPGRCAPTCGEARSTGYGYHRG